MAAPKDRGLRAPPTARPIVAATLAALLVASCLVAPNSTAGIYVRNETDVPLMFAVVWADGTEHRGFVVDPGSNLSVDSSPTQSITASGIAHVGSPSSSSVGYGGAP